MKLPKTIQVRGRPWKVLEKDVVLDEKGNVVAGACATGNNIREIEIEKESVGIGKLEIFLHEYFHGVWYETGLDDEEIPRWVEHIFLIAITKDLINNRKLIGKLLLGAEEIK